MLQLQDPLCPLTAPEVAAAMGEVLVLKVIRP
jgi:hypothetical protein